MAAVPPDDVIEHFEEFLAVRRSAGSFRWTRPEQWHLTLAFLPEVPDRSLDELVEQLAAAASRRLPLQLSIAGGGAFPDVARAKVLWAGLDVADSEELDRLAVGCRSAAVKAGVRTPAERFRPHVTVARSAHPFEASNWVRLLDEYQGPTYRLEEISLITSHLGEGPGKRPRYESRARFQVG